MLEFMSLAKVCAPVIAPLTMAAIVSVESSFNQYAIGVVDGYLPRQPASLSEAVATATSMQSNGWNFSLGLAQINIHNLPKYGITIEQAFDTCTNLRVGGEILSKCFQEHVDVSTDPQFVLQGALSCYYSGNYTRGFAIEDSGTSYVQRVLFESDRLGNNR